MKEKHINIYYILFICFLLVLMFMGFCLNVSTKAVMEFQPEPYTNDNTSNSIRTNRQDYLHLLAEMAREYGESEDSPIIQLLKEEWETEQRNLSILANTVRYEAGGCPIEHKLAVACVVINRVNSDLFPDTVEEVVGQVNTNGVWQYNPKYLTNFDNIPDDCWLSAKEAIDGTYTIPSDVIWQANFPQGKEIWWISKVDTGWFKSTTYFCR